MDMKKWMQKFLSAKKGKIFLPLMGVLAIPLGIFMLLSAAGDLIMLAMGVFFAAGGVYVAYSESNSASGTKNWMTMMEREGMLDAALTDFRDAADYLGGNLRLGQYWAFGKGAITPLAYGDMVRVYQHVHKTNFAEDGRTLIVITTSGDTRRVCELPLGGTGDQELNRALTFLLSRNPNIQIGYKK